MNLEQRLVRLEQANRRMKRIGTLVLVVAAAVLLSGAAGKDLPDLEVASLTLKDKAGKMRAQLKLVGGSPALILADKDGEPRVALKVVDGSPGLGLYDQDGMTRAALAVGADGSPALALFDKAGQLRAALAVTAESTLTLFDAKGDVIWKAPQ